MRHRSGSRRYTSRGRSRPAGSLLPAALAIVLAAVLAACGGSDEPLAAPDDLPSDAERIVAQSNDFNKDELHLPAGGEVSILLRNRDRTAHNVAIYPIQGEQPLLEDPVFEGEVINRGQRVYTFEAPDDAGQYFFHCTVHPDMKGEIYFE